MILGARLIGLQHQDRRHQQGQHAAGLEGGPRLEGQPDHDAEDGERAEAAGAQHRLEADAAHVLHAVPR